jgi:hypothetical protein
MILFIIYLSMIFFFNLSNNNIDNEYIVPHRINNIYDTIYYIFVKS